MNKYPRYKWFVAVYPTHFQAINLLPSESPDQVGRDNQAIAMIGPFRTYRAALWTERFGWNNPHFCHVSDAERLAK
jgi:hypothetical protein